MECLHKSNIQMNSECSKTNTEQMKRVQDIWIKVWKRKAAECLEI